MDVVTNNLRLSVSDFIALTNQTLEYAYPSVEIEGEVASFKVNQSKFVFFDLKDASGSIGCFMMLFQLRMPIEDGMKVIITASPKLTQWGKFSLTVRAIRPSGEGSLKKSFELLKQKLEKEGLFSFERKRALPAEPHHVAVISSTEAAGYADFIKIVNDRWGGLKIEVAHVQVQGVGAADQIIRALNYFNSLEELPEVIVIVRGGGSADDLSVFNDELLVREIATSRIPTLVGVGHEVDETLADMVADMRAATPSNAAQLLVPDRHERVKLLRHKITMLLPRTEQAIGKQQRETADRLQKAFRAVGRRYDFYDMQLASRQAILAQLDPRRILARGYAIIRGDEAMGRMIEIEKHDILIRAEVKNVTRK